MLPDLALRGAFGRLLVLSTEHKIVTMYKSLRTGS
jgi:hypothetical protein